MKNKIEVLPICFDGLDCVDNTILTVCNAVRGEYLQTFWNAWNLKFIQAFIHDRRTALSGSFISDNVKKIYGLVFQPVEHAGDRTGLLKKYFSEDGLVIMGIKTNCCPWQVSYKSSTYNLHYVIISEVVEKGVLCVDTMPQRQGELIAWEDVEEGIFSVIRVCDKGKETDSAKSVSLKRVYKNVRRNVKTGLIPKLITALEKDFYLYLELERNEAVWKVPLYCLFNMASGSHIQFFSFLLQSELQENTEILNQIKELGTEWEKLKILIVKLHREYQSAKLDKRKYENYRLLCLERLAVLEQKEKDVCKMFLRICKEKILNGAVPSLVDENRVWETTTYLPLAYNESSHMVCSKEYVIKTPIRFGQEWYTEKEKFLMPEVGGGDYNCLFCHGQRLPVGKRVRQISFLLYATYGTQFEVIELDFEKYTRSYILSASDWTEEPLTDEHVVWQSDFIAQDGENREIQKGKLVVKTIQIDVDNEMCREVILPYCDELHIFAITIR